MIGEQNYELLKEIKYSWDPDNIFNPGKIVDTPPMNTSLKFETDKQTPEIDTIFDFSSTLGIVRATEMCNGSGDCRKTEKLDGNMCPSYMATKDEKDSTRARANLLREFLTNSNETNPFDHTELYEVMDLCLSCKACKSECPSNVDMTKLKAEFLQHYYDSNKISFRTKAIANISKINAFASFAPGLTNFFLKNSLTSGLVKSILGFAQERSIPLLQKTTLTKWVNGNIDGLNQNMELGSD